MHETVSDGHNEQQFFLWTKQQSKLVTKDDWNLIGTNLAEVIGDKDSFGEMFVVVDTRKPKRYVGIANFNQKFLLLTNRR